MPDGRYSKIHVESDSELLSDAAQVRAMKGGSLGFTIGTNSLVALIVGVLTWYLTHQAAPPNCASKEDILALDGKVGALRQDMITLNQGTSKTISDTKNDLLIEMLKMRQDLAAKR
jgi:hypothetical protein